MKILDALWNWIVVLLITEKHKLAAERNRLAADVEALRGSLLRQEARGFNDKLITAKTINDLQSKMLPHPIIAHINAPKAWLPNPSFTDPEIEQLTAFFNSPTCAKLDTAIHNIAMQDMQRAWNCPAAQREFEMGAAQGRLAAWVTIKNFPATLTPQSGQTEDADTGAASLEHLRP